MKALLRCIRDMRWVRLLEPFRFRAYEGGGGLRIRAAHRARRELQRFFSFVESYCVVRDLTQDIDLPAARIAVETRLAGEADVPLFERKSEEVRANLAQGDRCLIALQQGTLVFSVWAATRPVWEGTMGITITSNQGETYLYDSYTDPRYRGLGLYTAMMALFMSRLRDIGYHTATAVITTTNVPVRRALHRLRWRTAERIVLFQLGRRRWIRRMPCRDRLWRDD